MSLLICGSIATDHLMTFGGKFPDSLVVEQLDKLVGLLPRRRPGDPPRRRRPQHLLRPRPRSACRPVLVGAAGEDFADYRSWLERHDVDCASVRISETRHTARFVCTTDSTMAQIASFYAGAMSEARLIELKPIVDRVGEPTYVLIGADDPEGMLRHTDECRQRGYPFIADPSQQLAFSDGELIRDLIDGAAYPVLQRVRVPLIETKTGWSADEVLDRVGTQVATLGADGVRILPAARSRIVLPAAKDGKPSSRPASATRSGRASWPRSSGTWRTSGPPRSAACSRCTSWRRSAPRSTTSRPRSSSSASRTPTATRRPPIVAPHLHLSAQPDRRRTRNRGVPSAAVSSPRYSCCSSGTRPGCPGGRPGRRRRTATVSPTASVADGVGQPMTGSGHPMPAAVQLDLGHGQAARSARSRATTPGRTASRPLDVLRRRVPGQRHPHVAVGERAHRGQHVARASASMAVHAEPLTRRRSPCRSSSVTSASPSTYRQEKVTRWGSRPSGSPTTSTSGIRATPRADPVDQRALARADLVALGHHGLEGGRGGQRARARSRSPAPARRSGRRRGRGAATGPPCGPAARRRRPAAPLVRGGRRGAPSRRERQPPRRGAGVGEEGYAGRGGAASPATRLQGADLVVGDLDGDARRRPRRARRPSRRPARAVDRHATDAGAPAPAGGCSTAECSTAVCTTGGLRRGRRGQARAGRGGPRRCPRR